MQAEPNRAVDPFANLLGIECLDSSFERATCRLTVADHHRNALKGIHGGLIFALADIAFAAACNAGEVSYIGLQAEVRYMNKVQGNTLKACASLIGGSKKIAHYQVLITDELDNRIALFTASAYRLSH